HPARRALARPGRARLADAHPVHRDADRRHAAQDHGGRRVARRGVPDARGDPRAAAPRGRAGRAARERRRRPPGVPARAPGPRAVGVSPAGVPAALGWDAAWEAARAAASSAAGPDVALEAVRIAAEHRGAYHALDRRGETAWVELTGRAFHRAGDKRALPTVGDWVLAERWPEAVRGGGAAVVRAVLPRRSFLLRRAAGLATAPQPLAANVDVGLVMTSANADLSPRRLDRYVGLLRDGGIEPVIAVSKLDLAADPAPLLAAARAVAGQVVGISVRSGAGLPEVRALVGPGRTCVLLGSSGVGKSSLLNA